MEWLPVTPLAFPLSHLVLWPSTVVRSRLLESNRVSSNPV